MRSSLQWTEHVERMVDDRLPERAAELREECRRRRGRPKLKWEDCVIKRDVRKAVEEEDTRQRRVEKTIRCGSEEGKRGRGATRPQST